VACRLRNRGGSLLVREGSNHRQEPSPASFVEASLVDMELSGRVGIPCRRMGRDVARPQSLFWIACASLRT